MILTITMNPSIDISYQLDKLNQDTVNRVTTVKKTAGGKGLNVTRVLKELGEEVVSSGLIGGTLGESIKKELDCNDIQHAFSPIEGDTRNCIAILHEGNQTEILENGPTISTKEAENFLILFKEALKKAGLVTISGSLPKGLSADYYSQLILLATQSGVKVILDCSGKPLRESLMGDVKPYLIKPNTEELSELLGKEITADCNQLKEALQTDLFSGVDWVVVSMGSKGAFAKHNDTFYQVSIPKITVVNPVGSGDSTIAGLASGIFHQESDEMILKKGMVLGMLNAQEDITGHVNMNNYQNLINQIKVVKI